jgi:hypothetical protein
VEKGLKGLSQTRFQGGKVVGRFQQEAWDGGKERTVGFSTGFSFASPVEEQANIRAVNGLGCGKI